MNTLTLWFHGYFEQVLSCCFCRVLFSEQNLKAWYRRCNLNSGALVSRGKECDYQISITKSIQEFFRDKNLRQFPYSPFAPALEKKNLPVTPAWQYVFNTKLQIILVYLPITEKSELFLCQEKKAWIKFW